MANKTFSRGTQTMGAEASMVFVGNTSHTVPYMLRTSDLFADLPDKYHDSAFLDRIHCFNPGWEIDNLRQDMFSSGYGFVVDYFAEILRALRNDDYSAEFNKFFTLGEDISARDRDGIKKTFSGLMKIIFPNNDATEDETKELLTVAIEGRKRVKDQLLRIDSTFNRTNFVFFKNCEPFKEIPVQTLEEIEFHDIYFQGVPEAVPTSSADQHQTAVEAPANETQINAIKEHILEEKHEEIKENQKGFSFNELVAPYLKGCKKLSITDPYIRNFFQQRNLMELLVSIVQMNYPLEEIEVHLITIEDEFKGDKQEENFNKMKESLARFGLIFTWEYDTARTIHARHIETDTGWKISLDRGLDVYQSFGGDAFDVLTYLPELRPCKAYEVTFIKINK